MAQPRTFQFYGLAYGNSPVTITAKINSTQIFSGTVPTLDQPLPGQPPVESDQVVLFTIDNSADLNTDFSGSLPMTLVVSGGDGIWVEQIESNYYSGNIQSDPNVGTVTGYNQCYQGNPVNSDNSQDPRSSVVIGGTPKSPQRPPEGTWAWPITSGQTMTHNFNISIGMVANTRGYNSSYAGDYAAFLKS